MKTIIGKTLNIKLLFLSFLLVTAACNDEGKNQKENSSDTDTVTVKTDVKKDCDEVHWSHHSGEDGPENWANLCEGFSACGGSSQSPIDIKTELVTVNPDLPELLFDYGFSHVNIINNGHTVQFNTDAGSNLSVNDKSYELLQFHYHALSEHTINGEHSALEVHFVNRHSDNDLSVIGAMIEEGSENSLFAEYLDKFPTKGEAFIAEEDSINLMSLLPESKAYYYYKGSLTTPPCSEVVSWYVLKEPIKASAEQIEQFSAILNNNYRPVQALNGREIFSNK
jgi:carbonic anhydrase